jgi:hypothetical protein
MRTIARSLKGLGSVRFPPLGLLRPGPGAYLRRVKKLPAEPKQAIIFKCNIVVPARAGLSISDQFIPAGQPSPFRNISEIPPNLLPFVGMPAFEPPRIADPYEDAAPSSLAPPLGDENEQYLAEKQTQMMKEGEARCRLLSQQLERQHATLE